MNYPIVYKIIVTAFLLLQSHQLVENLDVSKFNLTHGVQNNNIDKIVNQIPLKCKTTLVIVACSETPDSSNSKPRLLKNFDRQMSQLIVLLKSVAFTQLHGTQTKSNCVSVRIMSNDPNIVQNIWRILKEKERWSEEYSQILKLTYVPAIYPHGAEWMEREFRPCATLRLFLDTVLPDEDAVIYTDTDFIFLKSPQYLWNEFTNFKPNTVAGLSILLSIKAIEKFERENYNPTSLNSGLMLLNLTRMREIHWTDRLSMVSTMYLKNALLGDQDIVNIYFKYFPTQLIHIPCHWNFYRRKCWLENCALDGISSVHGVAGLFFSPKKNNPFYSIFKSFQEMRLRPGFSFDNFISKLENRLYIPSPIPDNPCTNMTKMSHPILKALRHLQQFKNENENVNVTEIELPSVDVIEKRKMENIDMTSNHVQCIQIALPFCENKEIENEMSAFNLTIDFFKVIANIQNENPLSKCVHIIVLSTNRSNLNRLNQVVKSTWDPQHLRLTFVKPTYPPEFNWMKSKYECGMLPFFYPDLFPSNTYDSLIHLDPNSLRFLPPNKQIPELNELWKQFKLFPQNSMVGISQKHEECLEKSSKNQEFNYKCTNEYEPAIMLLNLTRMREVGFTTKVLMIAAMEKDQIVLPVLDILGLYFKYFPQHVFFTPDDDNQCEMTGVQDNSIEMGPTFCKSL